MHAVAKINDLELCDPLVWWKNHQCGSYTSEHICKQHAEKGQLDHLHNDYWLVAFVGFELCHPFAVLLSQAFIRYNKVSIPSPFQLTSHKTRKEQILTLK